MDNTPRPFLPAVLTAGGVGLVALLCTVMAEILDRESVRFGSERESFFFVWVLQSLNPFGQTGLINDRVQVDQVLLPFVVGLTVLVVVTFLVALVTIGAARNPLGAWFGSWLAVVLASGLGGAASRFVYEVIWRDGREFEGFPIHAAVQDGLAFGYYWGVFVGFFIGLFVMAIVAARRPTVGGHGVPAGAHGVPTGTYGEPGDTDAAGPQEMEPRGSGPIDSEKDHPR